MPKDARKEKQYIYKIGSYSVQYYLIELAKIPTCQQLRIYFILSLNKISNIETCGRVSHCC